MAMRRLALLGWVVLVGAGAPRVWAEGCTTQSQMPAAERDALVTTAREVAGKIQGGDNGGLQALTIAEFAKDFASIRSLAGEIAPHLRGATLTVDQVYLLDGTQIKPGSTEPTQFFCALNGTQASVDFTIPGLTPARYAFVIVDARGGGVAPWRVPLLLRQDGGRWLLAGFYPRAMEAAGHDGVWYWREARRMTAAKQLWNAWLYYEEASALLRPANFVETTHLSKLEDEQRAATPPPISNGISKDVPLVLRGAEGTEFRITSLAPDTSLGRPSPDVAIRLDGNGAADAAALRARSEAAARALVAAYPELRQQFSGVFVVLENGGQVVFTNERPMSELGHG